jgi:prepilin-type N-terminal cleavage/methylation domain-containing protein
MNEKGFSLAELLVVLGIIVVAGAVVVVPALNAFTMESHLLGAGRVFKEEFLNARSIAVKQNVQTAIRFEQAADGRYYYSTYADRDADGVRSADIAAGIDERISGPRPLDAGVPRVRVGLLPGLRDPEGDPLGTEDPIRFGNSNMLSFSPLGTASPGTFYLAGDALQVAVRVTPGSARVRLLLCRRNRWIER